MKNAKRVDRRKDLWEVTVKPGSLGDVTVTLAGGRACGTAGAVCTSDGRALSATISTTVLGPVALSVADARVHEGTDETIDFTVSLSRASSGSVTVDYETADGTATAGSDYTARSGTLTFAPGDMSKTVAVAVLDDAVDEGEETLTFRLANATGAVIADGTATGTIVNSDPLQKMWLSRFGRTAASHVVDAVTGRLSAPSGGSQVTLGGQSIDFSALPAGTGDALRSVAGALGAEHAAEDDEPLTGLAAWPADRARTWEHSETAGGAMSRTLSAWMESQSSEAERLAVRATVEICVPAVPAGSGKQREAEMDDDAIYMGTRELAALLGLSPRTLDRYRVSGGGPKFYKFGNRVRYARADVEAWAAERRYSSTSEAACLARGTA